VRIVERRMDIALGVALLKVKNIVKNNLKLKGRDC
jgi:hypothetical protein